MPSLGRLDQPGVLHHIMIRGIERIAERVGVICEMDLDDIFTKGKKQRKVKARSLLWFWAVQELGISLTELAKYLEITVPGVGCAVERGQAIAPDNKYQLIE
jgi:putative transposase